MSYRVMHTIIPPHPTRLLDPCQDSRRKLSLKSQVNIPIVDCWNRDSIDASITLNARLRIFDSHNSSGWEYAAHRCCDRAWSGGISQVAFSSLLINVIIDLGDDHYFRPRKSAHKPRIKHLASSELASTQKLFSHNSWSCSSRRRRLQLERVDLEKVMHHTRDSVLE